MNFCFTVDDNIRAFENIAKTAPGSIFEDPYFAMLRRLHAAFDLKVQLNMFYARDGFSLDAMPNRYAREFRENADWLKLSFHSLDETRRPYEAAGYAQVSADCAAVHREILRFASEENLAKTTTIHFCALTEEGVRAMADAGVVGLLGLYGTEGAERVSYSIRDREVASRIRRGENVGYNGMLHAGIDIVLNNFTAEEILSLLPALSERENVRVMIHEQFFYPDYERYQPDFEEKLYKTFEALLAAGRRSVFFEDMIEDMIGEEI